MHRIHVVRHCLEDRHESWCSPDGAVVLLRDRGQRDWRAIVDVRVVEDAELLNGGMAMHVGDATMQATCPMALAKRLADQERIHLIFDA